MALHFAIREISDRCMNFRYTKDGAFEESRAIHGHR